jgi:hypothetical protein
MQYGWAFPPDWFTELKFPRPHAWFSDKTNWLILCVGELMIGLLLLTPLYGLAAIGCLYAFFIDVMLRFWEPMRWQGWKDPFLGWHVHLLYGIMAFSVVVDGFFHLYLRTKIWWYRKKGFEVDI